MIILATTNLNKVKEYNNIYSHFEFKTMEKMEIKEDGESFLENATIKANACFEKYKCCVMSDDSGLEIEGLHNFPGIFSSRFENGRGYIEASNDLLDRLKNIDNRKARYVCAIVLIDENGNKYSSIGYCEGKISEKIKGNNGFGYDIIFIPNGYDKTFAELGDSFKDSISHRKIAFDNLLKQLPPRFMRKHYHD